MEPNMPACTECDTEVPGDASICHRCGASLDHIQPSGASPVTNADYDPEAARKQFERRYGIDTGDRTVDEFLSHLDQQDYSLSIWFWLVVIAEMAGVILFTLSIFEVFTLGVNNQLVFPSISILLGLAIFADTGDVGLFKRWAKVRWTYVLLAVIPLVGHLAGLLYLMLRHLMYEQTVEHRKRLIEAGFDVDTGVGDD